ncbi:MAG: metal ABC transporter permease, partial [Mycobacterium sp.]
FDPEVADVSGVNVGRMEALLMVMLAATILFTMKIVGVLLISALLVTPAVIARMVTNSFSRMLVIAPLVGAVCGAIGMVISYHVDVSPGAVIILLASLIFVVVYAVTGARGRGNAAGMIH